MTLEKPQNIEEYKAWLGKKFGVKGSDLTRHETLFKSVGAILKNNFGESDFWEEIQNQLREWNDEYFTKTGFQLLAEGNLVLHIKSYESFLLKTFRRNVLENKNWPDEPSGGWITPENWIIRVKDIVRTLIVVKYLDGVDFVVEKLKSIEQDSSSCNGMSVSFEAREHGYYAAHVGINFETELPNIEMVSTKRCVNIEIQIATQLQDVIRKLTHQFYEARREVDNSLEVNRAWQWNYDRPEFVPNYLGHLLHFVEGMIMDIRNKGDRS